MRRATILLSLPGMTLLIVLSNSYAARPEANGGGYPFNNYGAIAYSRRTGSYGYGHHYPTRQSAEKRALKECAKSDCEILVWVKNTCAALAENRSGEIGWAWGYSKDEAIDLALGRCSKRGGARCRVLVAGCT